MSKKLKLNDTQYQGIEKKMSKIILGHSDAMDPTHGKVGYAISRKTISVVCIQNHIPLTTTTHAEITYYEMNLEYLIYEHQFDPEYFMHYNDWIALERDRKIDEIIGD